MERTQVEALIRVANIVLRAKKDTRVFAGGWTRDTMAEAFKIIPTFSAAMGKAVFVHTAILNDITAQDIIRFGRSSSLDEEAQEEETASGVRLVITGWYDLVPNGYMYLFAEPEQLKKLLPIVCARMLGESIIKKEDEFQKYNRDPRTICQEQLLVYSCVSRVML
jgi:hypothetical protein